MKRMAALFGLLFAALPALRAQETPTPITGKLPAKAVCVVCAANGESHGPEKPAAGVQYKNKAYYFCGKNEVAAFAKDPEAFLPPVLPRPAPAFSLPGPGNETSTLAGLKGKVVLLDFWATWCKPCVGAMPDLQKLHDRHAAKGFTVVGVSVDEKGAAAVRPFLVKNRYTYPILLDSRAETAAAYRVHAIPALFLVDKDGRIVRQWVGAADKKEIERAVAELLAGG
jgi:peroxiredoxin/YHS domain-containing protein